MSDNPYQSPEESGDVGPKSPFLPLWARIGLYSAVILLITALLIPAPRTAREAARRNACLNNLRQIGIALHAYHETHGALPPAYTVDANGNRLHSWRTLLLPYLDEQELYESIDLTKAWDDPANAVACEAVVDTFNCPSSPNERCLATYFAVTGEGTAFQGSEAVMFIDIADGAPQTIAIVDLPKAHEEIHWMEPRDVSIDELVGLIESRPKLAHPNIMQAAFFDGHVEAISLDIELAALRAMLTIAGGETIADE